MATFDSTLKPRLIYVFRIADEAHRGCLKIGETTCDVTDMKQLMTPCSRALNAAARHRIDQYTQTAGIAYDLLYTESTLYMRGMLRSFNDKEVHQVLLRSGIRRKVFDQVAQANEWFITDLQTVKRAIAAVKEGRSALQSGEIATATKTPPDIVFRPEQRAAIDQTKRCLKTQQRMLWNAKMRFGKTLTALQVVREMGYQRTLILTHRPVVNQGWMDDFGKIFHDLGHYRYGSRQAGDTFDNLEQAAQSDGVRYVYFASMQDLRGSKDVGGTLDKNHRLLSIVWDLVIVDEAHEGTQTQLGQAVINLLTRHTHTRLLSLSGTAFNLLDHYEAPNVYTWDYVMEQRAKLEWDQVHQGDPNPYADLPAMNICTYDLGRLLEDFMDEDVSFNFREFFRTRDDDGTFVHQNEVGAFLNLLVDDSAGDLYPFARPAYRQLFRHTLWVLPGVRAAKAMSALLRKHPVFGYFRVVNVAGEGDEEQESDNALKAVNDAIGPEPENTLTITLTCGRLTTGVTVPAWTAVMMLSGSYETSCASYMQTIFRVQSPAKIAGRVKDQCYVFDFAPDRTLRIMAETVKMSTRPGKDTSDDRRRLGELLNFCPVIGMEGSTMKPYDVQHLLEQLKRVYVERVVRHGFEDNHLYNDQLLQLDDNDLKDFENLKKTIGQTKAMPRLDKIDINRQGLTNEEYEELQKLKKEKRQRQKELSQEERQRMEELREKAKVRQNAIATLRGISIRMPLMIYGAELENESDDITLDNFTRLVDEKSWKEFMPKGVDKATFQKFKRFYDPEIFAAAGRRIRQLAREADDMDVEERIERITSIFSTFRNPDKETVLTPWRVVCMHMADCLGGWTFYDPKLEHCLRQPRWVEHKDITQRVFHPDTRILEINSKTGLYPLYVAYSTYRATMASMLTSADSIDGRRQVWDRVVGRNIFVVCKTPMAKSITRRTLVGFRTVKVNTRCFDDLINQIKHKPENFLKKMQQGKAYWKANDDDKMKFDAVVGNPPYQVMDGGAGASAVPVYQHFVNIALKTQPALLSLIMPSRWMTGGRGLDEFRKAFINDKRIRVLHDFYDASACFTNVEIKGGVCYFLWDKTYDGPCAITSHIDNEVVRSTRFLKEDDDDEIFIRDSRLIAIKSKCSRGTHFDTIVSSMKPYGLRGDLFKDPGKYGLPAVSATKLEGGYEIIGLNEKMKRQTCYVPTDYPFPQTRGLLDYKIFVTRNYGIGTLGESPSDPILAVPGQACTETFVQIGPFNSPEQTKACKKYMDTKLFRCLVGIKKHDQGAGKGVYCFVPLQDFTPSSDIDWSQTVDNIDRQLYNKYDLEPEEVDFIERVIKPILA